MYNVPYFTLLNTSVSINCFWVSKGHDSFLFFEVYLLQVKIKFTLKFLNLD